VNLTAIINKSSKLNKNIFTWRNTNSFEKNWQGKMIKIIRELFLEKINFETSSFFFLINRINSLGEKFQEELCAILK
jgi:hypothetical protein